MPVLAQIRSWLARQIAPAPKKAPPPKKRLRGHAGRPKIRGTYDAAEDTIENAERWPGADSMSANAANDKGTRQTLRDRSRNECENNSYAGGMVDGIASDVVGTGPRPQLTIPGVSRDVCRILEAAWGNWSRAADIPEDLRILHKARLSAGEGFGVMINNPTLLDTGLTSVALDLKLYEAEQVSDPFDFGVDPLYADGVRLDQHGNPVEYTFLKNHPGGVSAWFSFETVKIAAGDVLHWFKPDRPGQARGIPALTPGLPLFAQLRRYTLATLTAAEFAAVIAGVMKTTSPADDGAEVEVTALQDIDLVRGALLTLPHEWDAEQFKPEHPTTTYGEFKNQVLGEIGRGLNAPFNVIAGNSSGYNYSSGRLDHLLYQKATKVERSRLENRILNRLFVAWVREAMLAGVVKGLLPKVETWSWTWHWDGFDSIDPLKDAQADQIDLALGKTNLAELHARKGQDWEEAMRQRASELALAIKLEKELGLPVGSLSGLPTVPSLADPNAPTQPEESANAEPATAS